MHIFVHFLGILRHYLLKILKNEKFSFFFRENKTSSKNTKNPRNRHFFPQTTPYIFLLFISYSAAYTEIKTKMQFFASLLLFQAQSDI